MGIFLECAVEVSKLVFGFQTLIMHEDVGSLIGLRKIVCPITISQILNYRLLYKFRSSKGNHGKACKCHNVVYNLGQRERLEILRKEKEES